MDFEQTQREIDTLIIKYFCSKIKEKPKNEGEIISQIFFALLGATFNIGKACECPEDILINSIMACFEKFGYGKGRIDWEKLSSQILQKMEI